MQGNWLKIFPALHQRTGTQMDDMNNNGIDIPKQMKTRKRILRQKKPCKGNAVDSYWPFSCLSLMRKLMTGIANSV